MLRFFSAISLIGFGLAIMAGCNQSTSSADSALVAKYRNEFALATEPEGVQTVLDVREKILGPIEATPDHEGHEHADHEHEGHDHAAEDSAASTEPVETTPEHDHGDPEHATEEHVHEDQQGHDHEGHEHADHEHADHEHEHAEESPDIDLPTNPIKVVMVGQIGGLTNPWQETQPDFPFVENRAQVFIADPGGVAELAASGHVHAPGEECAFCAAHAADNSEMIAMVRFLDDQDQLVRVSVQELFDVEAGDTVVVKGTARVVPGGMLVVDAEGLYVRR